MFVILVGCWMSTATESLSSCSCNYTLKSVCLPAGHSVVIPCPELTKEEVRFTLLKNHEVIHREECNTVNCTPMLLGAGVRRLMSKTENKSISFELTVVNDSSHGAYRCEATGLLPPPRLPSVYSVGKLVLVEGHHCKINNPPEDPPTGGKESRDFPWVWILALVSVIIYSVIITVCALFYWIKLKKTDSQSDYMNTKPRPLRGHRKNRGVQNPAPRYLL